MPRIYSMNLKIEVDPRREAGFHLLLKLTNKAIFSEYILESLDIKSSTNQEIEHL